MRIFEWCDRKCIRRPKGGGFLKKRFEIQKVFIHETSVSYSCGDNDGKILVKTLEFSGIFWEISDPNPWHFYQSIFKIWTFLKFRNFFLSNMIMFTGTEVILNTIHCMGISFVFPFNFILYWFQVYSLVIKQDTSYLKELKSESATCCLHHLLPLPLPPYLLLVLLFFLSFNVFYWQLT